MLDRRARVIFTLTFDDDPRRSAPPPPNGVRRARPTKIQRRIRRNFHTNRSRSPYLLSVKRSAFVLRLGPETKPSQGLFGGWIAEVDTGRELRFRSTEELLAFLGACYEVAQKRKPPPRADDAS